MKKMTITLSTALMLTLISPVIYAADRPDLDDITMDVIRSEDAHEIANEIELPEIEHHDNETKSDECQM